jgi:hypothetical protein
LKLGTRIGAIRKRPQAASNFPMGGAGNIILEADDVDPKDWVYATFKWTPADLLRVFRATFQEICRTESYACDYPALWAKFDGV